ncbi:DUF6226 family protein [Microbacterium sp. NPDC089987]|uniref:DUF6226 family protein n=1 Tax=Microbacterium sp. NPDC089987 TaxID=3364202 RepID=UPI0037FE0A9E
MTAYLRPAIASPVFRDDDGRVIEYGRRWPDSPPEDTYSVDRHPERFAPLHTVADALVAHLRTTYDVEVQEGVEVASDLLHPHPDVVRAVRIRPPDPACAVLTFVFTAYPGVFLHAGLLHDFHYPTCGCEACDEEWTAEAERLEEQVLAVVTGNYRESIDRGRRPWVESETTFPNGSSSGQARAEDFPPERLTAALPILTGRTEAWAAWPPAR